MDGGQKTSDQANYKGQLAFTVRGERRLMRIVRMQRSQTLAQITIQRESVQSVNGLCNPRFTVGVSEAIDLRECHCSMLAIELHVLSAQESTETGV
ncbi:hypothetical protein TNCV_746841 [Trichonephila clavipes]|nr:hypothetical protein TNCV_746841 [Trichonephila clavipes]